MSLHGKIIYYILTGARKSKIAHENIEKFRVLGAEVYVILTEEAKQFVSLPLLKRISNHSIRDSFKKDSSEPSLPLEDLIVVAPATYNTVNKIANGVADNLATSLVATAIGRGTPIYIAPNMNVNLWSSPITQNNIEKLKKFGVNIVHPQIEDDYCTMAEPLKIFDSVVHDHVRIRFNEHQLKYIKDGEEIIQRWYPKFKRIGRKLTNDQNSSAGCISVRIKEGFLVTSSGACLGNLGIDDLTIVSRCCSKENYVEWYGSKPPSSESPLHFAAYEFSTEINSVIHVHYPHLTYASSFKEFRSQEYYSYGTFEFGEKIVKEMHHRNLQNFIIAKDHGQVITGLSLENAYNELQDKVYMYETNKANEKIEKSNEGIKKCKQHQLLQSVQK
ncbi:TPA: class II aldolase/adducin family protein [Bacillus cereus]|nr:class II aldolase/adducin family protein [Bacillus cereus]